MEALGTVSVVSSIVQLVDFSSKCIAKSVELHRSCDGALEENINIEAAVRHLSSLTEEVRQCTTNAADAELQDICVKVVGVSSSLLRVLDTFKTNGTNSKIRSLRKVIRCVWSKERVQELEAQLAGFRAEINLHIVVRMRLQLHGIESTAIAHFAGSDATTKQILSSIVTQRDLFERNCFDQATLAKSLHTYAKSHMENTVRLAQEDIVTVIAQTEQTNQEEHNRTRAEQLDQTAHIIDVTETSQGLVCQKVDVAEGQVIAAIQSTQEMSSAEHANTQNQIRQLTESLRLLSDQISDQEQALKEAIEKLSHCRNTKQRKTLQERSNAIMLALFTLEELYKSLQAALRYLQNSAVKIFDAAKSMEIRCLAEVAQRMNIRFQESCEGKTPTPSTMYSLPLIPIRYREEYFATEFPWMSQHKALVDIDTVKRRWRRSETASSMEFPVTSWGLLLLAAVTKVLSELSADAGFMALHLRLGTGNLMELLWFTFRKATHEDQDSDWIHSRIGFFDDLRSWIAFADSRDTPQPSAEKPIVEVLRIKDVHHHTFFKIVAWLVGDWRTVMGDEYWTQEEPLYIYDRSYNLQIKYLVRRLMALGFNIGMSEELGAGPEHEWGAHGDDCLVLRLAPSQ